MCVACIEYLKDRLTEGEFKSALKETTIEDPRHLAEIERIFRENQGNSDAIKRALKALEVK